MTMVTVSSCASLQKPGTENTAQDSSTGASSLPVRLQRTAPQTQTAQADLFFTQKPISRILKHFKWTQTAQVRFAAYSPVTSSLCYVDQLLYAASVSEGLGILHVLAGDLVQGAADGSHRLV